MSRDTSFPYWLYSEYTAFGSNISHIDLFQILRHQIGAKLYSLQWWRMGEHRPHPGPRGRVPAVPVQKGRQIPNHRRVHQVRRSEARKPRLQILASRFDQEIDIGSRTGLIAAGWTKERSRAQRMVATMVRSSIVRTFELRIRSSCCALQNFVPEHVRSLGRSIPRDKAISPGRHHFAGHCTRWQRQCALIGGTVCTLRQREHFDQDCVA